MKKLIPLLAVCLLAFAPIGCKNTQGLPAVSTASNVNASHYTVVRAEQALKASKDTFDLLFTLEDDNRAFVKANLPKVHAEVERLRGQVPDILIRANAIKNKYKHNRTADNQTSLDTIMVTLEEMTKQAEDYTKQIK